MSGDITHARDRCPVCGHDKVKLKTGFCWECENCKLRIGRAFKTDPYGKFLHLAASDIMMDTRQRLKQEWEKITKENPDKRYWINVYTIEEVVENTKTG